MIKNLSTSLPVSSSSSEDQSSPKKLEHLKKLQVCDAKIISLHIQNATLRVMMVKSKDLKSSQNLRWVRDNRKNRRILKDYLTKIVLVSKVIRSDSWSYLACCNNFSCRNPTGRGHKGGMENPLFFLLEKEERSKVLTFKENFLSKNSQVPKKARLNLLRHELFAFMKTQLELKNIKRFIESLPKKDGCFHLPLCRATYSDDCPGHCPLAKSHEPLDFKVDLISIEKDDINTNEIEEFQMSPKREKELQGSGGKYLKRLKIEGESSPVKYQQQSQSQLFTAPVYQVAPPLLSLSQNYALGGGGHQMLPQSRVNFDPSSLSPPNFHFERNQSINQRGSIFKIYPHLSPLSASKEDHASNTQEMEILTTQFKNLNLSSQPRLSRERPELESTNLFSDHFQRTLGEKTFPEESYQRSELNEKQAIQEKLKKMGILIEKKQKEADEIIKQIKLKEEGIKEDERDIELIDKEIRRIIRRMSRRRKRCYLSESDEVENSD